ncbi:MAG: PAS domain S-box protein [Desulfobacula sp.]|jgi:PAS domain S-box-containing protein|uniref:PAS domain-containing hybrid sensor histidine kinase/response regulator n=1 Tax=Desulfobacula sp. TaxID=2593537 RepID=UPI001DFDEC5F|nr:PAS domain S-box protein [Desulfobacula sp.]MBT3483671.1 PAS domain S-box protein [Desulfobacula sp.]MBT4023346.1 PAS domain S-box protein [Desulfobacula sp.]MBT4197331.1 PAS domain S-box protein [Desulfobacula sp.]MBT4505011.1 PAS domain S-box protein [Desulfobacula sp.]
MTSKPTYEELKKRIQKLEQSEKKAKQSEERYRLAFQTSPDAINLNRVSDGMYLDCNEGFTKIMGYTREEVIGKTSLSLNIWENIEDRKKLINRLSKNGHVNNMEARFVDKKGKIKTGLMSAHIMQTKGEKIILSVTRDITKIKNSEEALRASHERFLMVLNSLDATIYVADMKTYEILFMNNYMINSFGRDMTGEICWKVFRGESGPCPHCKNDELIDEKGKPTDVCVWQDKNPITGKWYINYDRAIEWTDGRMVKLQIATDITERKQIEEDLRKSEELYREYFEENISGTYISTPEGQLLACNKEYVKIFGLDSIQHAKDIPVTEIIINPDKRVKFLNRIRKEKRVTGYEPILKKIDGTPIHLFENATGVFDEKGKLTHIRGSILDVTEQRRLEIQLQQSQKMEAIGTLAGGIAHDFNNILFPIMGHSEMLMMDLPEDSPSYMSLNEIYTGAIRARDLVKQILAFSRQENNELKLMRIQPVIVEALKLIRALIPKTIEIDQDINENCGVIKSDPTQIHQIIMNLTTNAYHAMEDTGGQLKVSLKQVKLGMHNLINPDMEPGIYACLAVVDSGVGMDADLTKKIFDPFFTTKEQGKGTGMGLSVVHGIVRSNGGAIQIYSRPGEGSQFYVYLPVIKSAFEKQIIQNENNVQPGTGKILLVDDEKAIISMEKRMLERLGYQVASHTSSLEALEIFRENPDKFDLVITDMAMPNMSGDQLSVEMTKIRPDIPVLLCTGYSETMSEEKAVSIGIKGFLLKPIRMKDLAQKVSEILKL